MKVTERAICPRCGRIKLVREKNFGTSEFDETCYACGYARDGKINGEVLTTDSEWGGYGRITYTDKKSGNQTIIPFDEPKTQNAAKREFLRWLRTHHICESDAVGVSRYDSSGNVLEEYDLKRKEWIKKEIIEKSLSDDGKKRWEENYCFTTENEEAFLAEIEEMELETQWVPGVISKDLRVTAIPSPLEASSVCVAKCLDPEITFETATEGSKLVLDYKGRHWNVSSIGRSTLYETAKLWGSSLSRMSPISLAQNLNNSLMVSRGQTLLLIRQKKIMAFHSDGSYCVMPISALIELTQKALENYGHAIFKAGFHSNSYTLAEWRLPDVQSELITKYQDALQHTPTRNHAVNFMPIVRFSSSDTAHCAATIQPMFEKQNGVCFPVGLGISVKHEMKAGTSYGLTRFEEESEMIFAKFNESIENLQRMARVEIYNPVNTCVGIFNYLNRKQLVIPRKYADVVREEIEHFSINSPIMSMHDIYLSMADCIGLAKESGASRTAIINIEEAITKVLFLDWKSFDIGGVIAWGDRQAG